MLNKHDVSILALCFERDSLISALTEAYQVVQNCKNIESTIKEYTEGSIDEFDVIDTIQDCSSFDLTDLEKFKTYRCSKKLIVNKYLVRVFSDVETLLKKLKRAEDASFCITDDEVKDIQDSIYKVISGMIFFILVEFDVFDCLNDNGDVVLDSIDEIVVSYCQRYCKEPKDFLTELCNDSKVYTLKFDVFDSNPELELPFQQVMGPSIVGVDEEQLTLDIVKKVIAGDISPEDLVASMMSTSEGVEDFS